MEVSRVRLQVTRHPSRIQSHENQFEKDRDATLNIAEAETEARKFDRGGEDADVRRDAYWWSN